MFYPYVSSEGGPVILADFEALRSWRGAFHDSGDYERACETLGDSTICELAVGGLRAVVWHMGGPGTADIVQVSAEHISLVRIWPDASWSEQDCTQAVTAAATERFGSEELAQVVIHSGYLLALWAPEDMTACGSPSGGSGAPDDLSMGGGGAYIKVPPGRYSVSACEWQAEKHDVTKIDLRLCP